MSRPATHMKVNGVRDHAVSDGGASVTVTFSTRYVGDFELAMPAGCVDQLVDRLTAVQSAANPDHPPAPVASSRDESPVKVRVPKTWLVTADHTVGHGVVLLVFDHHAGTQIGFALDPVSARKIAAGLNEEADAVSTRRKRPAG